VAKYVWSVVPEILEISVGYDFESVAKLWVLGNKYKLVNVCTSMCYGMSENPEITTGNTKTC
jgi:hypothetical protein